MALPDARTSFHVLLRMSLAAALASLFCQLPALYGPDGLLPSAAADRDPFAPWRTAMLPATAPAPASSAAAPTATMEHYALQDSLAVLGMLAVALSMPRGAWGLALATACYRALYGIGRTFLSFQWDILLLEVAAAALLSADVFPCGGVWGERKKGASATRAANKRAGVWLLRWILVKFMLLSGLVKLQADCPTWKRLTALEYHLATQCIPGPFAWFVHQAHPFFLRLGVAFTLWVETLPTLLLIAPFTAWRRIGVILQVLLQIVILLTGNYNFFNVLTIALCLVCWSTDYDDDDDNNNGDEALDASRRAQPPTRGRQTEAVDRLEPGGLTTRIVGAVEEHGILGAAFRVLSAVERHPVGRSLLWLTGFALCVWSWFVSVRITIPAKAGARGNLDDWRIEWLISWETAHATFVQWFPVVFWYGATFLLLLCLAHVAQETQASKRLLGKLLRMTWAVALGLATLLLFAIGTVPYYSIDQNVVVNTVPPLAVQLYQQTLPYHLTSSYGLFRRMTGVGQVPPDSEDHFGVGGQPPSVVARPEIVLEGYNKAADEWREIDFRHKPTDVFEAPPVIVPHQPRVDWQMWFAALSQYQREPWFVHLVDKLLDGSPTAQRLVNVQSLRAKFPETNGRPDAIRATLYSYDFTRWNASFVHGIPRTEILVDEQPAAASWTSLMSRWTTCTHRPWWTRYNPREYFPTVRRNDASVLQFLQHHGLARYSRSKDKLRAMSRGERCGGPAPSMVDVSHTMQQIQLQLQDSPGAYKAAATIVLDAVRSAAARLLCHSTLELRKQSNAFLSMPDSGRSADVIVVYVGLAAAVGVAVAVRWFSGLLFFLVGLCFRRRQNKEHVE